MKPTHVPIPDSEELATALGDVVDDYLERRAAGERPDVSEYAKQHPEIADLIRQSLRALEVVGDTVASAGQSLDESSIVAPKTLGDFRILGELGRGGMGVVYEAEQMSLGRMVALKVLPFAAIMDPRAITRFKNEARAAATLDHPNIVPVHGVGNERGVYYYAMSLINGLTLAEIISRLRDQILRPDDTALSIDGLVTSDPERPTSSTSSNHQLQPTIDSVQHAEVANLTARDHYDPTTNREIQAAVSTRRSRFDREYFRSVARLGAQAAEALDHAHQRGIVHRDIKPGNLMVDHQGKPWVTDFGLARIESEAGLTMTGDIVGTLRYMAPEQALVKRSIVDHRVDIYSLGATLYELISLQPVFGGRDRQSILRQIAETEPTPPRRTNPSIPRDLETIVLKAISKDPAERYQTAEAMAHDLRSYSEDLPIQAKRASPVARVGRLLRRHRPLVVATTGVTMLALAMSTIAIAIKQDETNAALNKSIEETQRAERNLAIARGVVDRIYDNLYSDDIVENRLVQAEGEEQALREMSLAYEELARTNHESPELRLQNALAWQRIGWIRFHLWQGDLSLAAWKRSVAELDDLAATPDHPPQVDRERALSTRGLAYIQRDLGELDQAELMYSSAISQFDALLDSAAIDDDLRADRSQAALEYAIVLSTLGRHAEAEQIFRENLPIQQELVRVDPEHAEKTDVLAAYYQYFGYLISGPGRNQEAATMFEEAKRWRERSILLAQQPRSDRRLLAGVHEALDFTYWEMGKTENAIAARQAAFEIRRELLRRWPSAAQLTRDLVFTARILAARTQQDRPYEQALEALDEALQTVNDSKSEANFIMDARLELLHQKAILLLFLRRNEESEQAYRHAYAALRDLRKVHPRTLTSAMNIASLLNMSRGLATSLERQGRRDDAAEAFDIGIGELDHAIQLVDATSMASDYNSCAWALSVNDSEIYTDEERALKFAKRAVELTPPGHFNAPRHLNTLGAAQFFNELYEDAVKSLVRSKELCPDKLHIAVCFDDLFLCMCYWQLNEQQQAIDAYRNARHLYTTKYSYIGELKRLLTNAEEMLKLPESERAQSDIVESPALGYPFDFTAFLPSAPLTFTRHSSQQ